MKFICPNRSSKEWKNLVKIVGSENKAYKAFVKNDYNIPTIEKEITDEFGKGIINALEDITKRLKILESAQVKPSDKEVQELRKTHDKLIDALIEGTHKEGLLYFAQQLTDEIVDIDRTIDNADKGSIRNRASRARRSLSFIDSTIPIIEDITTYLVDKEMDAQEQELYDILSSKRAVLQKKRNAVLQSSRNIFTTFLTPFLGERNNPKLLAEINKNLPPNKQLKEFDLMTALMEGDKDINFLDKWLRSMANSRNDVLKLINEAVQRRKQSARINALEDRYTLLDIRNEYFKSGGKNFDWLYEKDNKGELTGNFISERRWTDYYRDKREHRENLLKSYNVETFEDLELQTKLQFTKEITEWEKNNTDLVPDAKTGKKFRKPSMSKYGNKDYINLNQAQRKALDGILAMKEELDSKLHPKHRHSHRIPQVSKDFFERMKNIKDKGQIREVFASEFHDRDYDVDQGDTSNVEDAAVAYVLGDRGREVELLPIHFTKKLDNMKRDLSLDIISSMVVYSNMARDYEEMDNIIDALELGREVLREQKVKATTFQGAVKKTVSYVGGTRIEKSLFKDDNLALQKYENWMSMIVYGKTRLKGKTFKIAGKEFDREKSLDKLGQLTAINSLALNIYSGLSNIAFGETMLRTEALAGRYFTEKDLIKANAEYAVHLPNYLSKHGNVHNTSKMGLWADRFDTLQDYQSDKYQVDSMRRTWFARSMKISSLFFINNAGEHFMQNRTSYALAQSTKLKDKSGKEISLWDAYEVKNGRLRLKEGITKLDGSEWTKEDEITFSRRQDFINQRMHGIYNENDKTAIQKYAVGRLAMMFRKFIIPGFDRRWELPNYNFMLDDFTEGYYITTSRFVGNVLKDLTQMKFSVVKNWNELSDLRKSNLKKTMTELTTLLGLTILLNFGLGGDDADKDWLDNMLEYQARRVISELMFFSNPNEALKILRSPSAALNYIEKSIEFTGSLFGDIYSDVHIQSGRYKDWRRWQKEGLQLFPMYRTIDRAFHPEEAVRWWQQ